MILAVALVLAAAPPQESVVQFGAGLGFFITGEGAVLTTHETASKIVRPEATLFDGTTAQVLQVAQDDAQAGFAVVLLDVHEHAALELASAPPTVGARVAVVSQDGAVEGDVGAVHGDTVSLDAGERAGSPVVDEKGQVVGMLRAPGEALRAGAVLEQLAPKAPTVEPRYRNLGISVAFFLGLMGWWKYRLKGRRY